MEEGVGRGAGDAGPSFPPFPSCRVVNKDLGRVIFMEPRGQTSERENWTYLAPSARRAGWKPGNGKFPFPAPLPKDGELPIFPRPISPRRRYDCSPVGRESRRATVSRLWRDSLPLSERDPNRPERARGRASPTAPKSPSGREVNFAGSTRTDACLEGGSGRLNR